jgi:hypothetical protein
LRRWRWRSPPSGCPGLPDGLRAALLVAAYPILAVFLVANRRLPGMPLVALGGPMNLLAISVNGGVMPASPSALAGAGLPVGGPGFHNSAVLADPRLGFLGDVFFIPASWPLSNIFSVGDVLIGLGVAWALHRVYRSRLTPRGRGQAKQPAEVLSVTLGKPWWARVHRCRWDSPRAARPSRRRLGVAAARAGGCHPLSSCSPSSLPA